MFPWNFTPFNKDTLKKLQQMKPDEVEKYVNDMLGKVMPPEMQGMNFSKGTNPFNINATQPEEKNNNGEIQAQVFDTHDDVFVIIPVKERSDLEMMRIYHTSNQLMIEHFPKSDDKHTISLPAVVKKKGSRASFKEGTLEIKLPKSIHTQYTEIDIQDFD